MLPLLQLCKRVALRSGENFMLAKDWHLISWRSLSVQNKLHESSRECVCMCLLRRELRDRIWNFSLGVWDESQKTNFRQSQTGTVGYQATERHEGVKLHMFSAHDQSILTLMNQTPANNMHYIRVTYFDYGSAWNHLHDDWFLLHSLCWSLGTSAIPADIRSQNRKDVEFRGFMQ